jgi:hypothetical protein
VSCSIDNCKDQYTTPATVKGLVAQKIEILIDLFLCKTHHDELRRLGVIHEPS